MSKGKARFTVEQMDAMGLEPDGNGGWQTKGKHKSSPGNHLINKYGQEALDKGVPLIGVPENVTYVHIRYSPNSDGAPMREEPIPNGYIGMYHSKESEDSENPADYEWRDIRFANIRDMTRQSEQQLHNKPKVYVGVDPGKSGAICFTHNGKLEKWVIPIAGKDIDANALYGIFKDISDRYSPVVVLEDVHSLFGMSAASNFSFGFVCGMIRAMVIANKIPFHMIPPKTWQKIIWTNDDKVYKPKKPGQKNPSVDTKATSLKAATRIFPNFDFTKNQRSSIAHDGIVDGILLSEYGRRLNL